MSVQLQLGIQMIIDLIPYSLYIAEREIGRLIAYERTRIGIRDFHLHPGHITGRRSYHGPKFNPFN